MSPVTPFDLELWLIDSSRSRSIPLAQNSRVLIGRAPECDIVLDDNSVSRRHAALQLSHELKLEDLDSANGTWLRHDAPAAPEPSSLHGPLSTRPGLVRVPPGSPSALRVGDAFQVGSVLLVVRARSMPSTAGVVAAPPIRPVLAEPSMQQLYATAERVAVSDLSVLILGETGVGKEILAETIHRASRRAPRPFLRLHCASLSATLLESELFGHEQGAFTGATRAKIGLLQSAEGGTVFLDEVGELPLDFQVKLLRVLEARTLTRVGGVKSVQIDVRFVAATHRDLRREVEAGRFREDLLYRLDGVSLTIPPLRERRSEIPLLAQEFVKEVARSLGLSRAPTLLPATLASLVAYPWPGNVRELRHLIERAVVLCRGDAITPADLMPSVGMPPVSAAAGADTAPPVAAGAETSTLPREIELLERRRIEEALERCGGNQSRAAEVLGISRRTLVARLSEFGLTRPRKRPAD